MSCNNSLCKCKENSLFSNRIDHVEELAIELHEAGRIAVEQGNTVNSGTRLFLEWGDITDMAKEGRRIQARYLLERFEIKRKD